MLADQIHAIGSTLTDTNLESIHFVVVNINCSGSAVALPPDASVTKLYSALAESCHISFPFELQMFGETIVSSRSLTNQSLEGIPSIASTTKDMNEIWGPGFRIPLRLYRLSASDQDLAVYASLARMFGGSNTNIRKFGWYQFIMYCLESRSCLETCICNRFGELFVCREGKLTTIKLRGQHIRGHLDLSATPRTVRNINLKGNELSYVHGLDGLAGKELLWLEIRGNPKVEIDLKQLRSVESPLKVLRVNLRQISRGLIGKKCRYTFGGGHSYYDEVHDAATRWIQTSTLDLLGTGSRSRCHYITREINRTYEMKRSDYLKEQ